MNFNELIKSKTFWTGVAGLVTAAGGYLSGEASLMTAIYGALGSLAAIFLRTGVEKAASGETSSEARPQYSEG